MAENNLAEWHKELQLLLTLIQAHPSQDMSQERDRIVVLNKLIAAHESKVDA